ncbi:hypothetical protein C0585_02280 [Candidatus Woesearchaeota archaeon]|nr:MAG: hypothetical protein C0585_02280 [Candidatus Woesearchaeota archaeon]
MGLPNQEKDFKHTEEDIVLELKDIKKYLEYAEEILKILKNIKTQISEEWEKYTINSKMPKLEEWFDELEEITARYYTDFALTPLQKVMEDEERVWRKHKKEFKHKKIDTSNFKQEMEEILNDINREIAVVEFSKSWLISNQQVDMQYLKSKHSIRDKGSNVLAFRK